MEESKSLIKKRGNFLFRQELRNLTLEPTPLCSLICNLIVGILFIAIMIPLLNSTKDYITFRVEYTDCNNDLTLPCEKTLEVTEDMEGPIMVFYEIEDFFINHKEFVRSKVYTQLRSETDQGDKFFLCEGAQYMWEVKDDGNYTTYTGNPLTNMSIAVPCGLFAKYEFNDTFTLFAEDGSSIFINETNIALKEHRELLFKNSDNATNVQWKDMEDGKLMYFNYFVCFTLNLKSIS